MAVAAPGEFPHAALSERLIGYALDDDAGATQTMHRWLSGSNGVPSGELERAINADGYAIRESLGARKALKIFAEQRAVSGLAQCVGQLGRVPCRAGGEGNGSPAVYESQGAGDTPAVTSNRARFRDGSNQA